MDQDTARAVANIQEHRAKLQSELEAPILRGQNYVLMTPDGWCARITDDGTGLMFRGALLATRWTEQDARKIAATLPDIPPAWGPKGTRLVPVPYLDALRENIAGVDRVIESLQFRA